MRICPCSKTNRKKNKTKRKKHIRKKRDRANETKFVIVYLLTLDIRWLYHTRKIKKISRTRHEYKNLVFPLENVWLKDTINIGRKRKNMHKYKRLWWLVFSSVCWQLCIPCFAKDKEPADNTNANKINSCQFSWNFRIIVILLSFLPG